MKTCDLSTLTLTYLYRLSAIGYRLSAITYPYRVSLSAITYRVSATRQRSRLLLRATRQRSAVKSLRATRQRSAVKSVYSSAVSGQRSAGQGLTRQAVRASRQGKPSGVRASRQRAEPLLAVSIGQAVKKENGLAVRGITASPFDG